MHLYRLTYSYLPSWQLLPIVAAVASIITLFPIFITQFITILLGRNAWLPGTKIREEEQARGRQEGAVAVVVKLGGRLFERTARPRIINQDFGMSRVSSL